MFSRHTYYKFPTGNPTVSIISLWSVDLGIKGCFWKDFAGVWEQNGWPSRVVTVCHFVAFGTHHIQRVLHHVALLSLLQRGVWFFMAQSEGDLVKAHRDGVLKFWWMSSGRLCTVYIKPCHIIKSKIVDEKLFHVLLKQCLIKKITHGLSSGYQGNCCQQSFSPIPTTTPSVQFVLHAST